MYYIYSIYTIYYSIYTIYIYYILKYIYYIHMPIYRHMAHTAGITESAPVSLGALSMSHLTREKRECALIHRCICEPFSWPVTSLHEGCKGWSFDTQQS